ncbi:tyrosine-protein phosphatase [Nocardia sp. CWNU-33]|uniref:tyrosine-protein phosphatase n=1 Tax=Nocardia sp. CWNU-33 TaxID=3392117 RepID=UPI00398E541C
MKRHTEADWRAAYPNRMLTWPSYGRAPAEVMRLVLDDLAAAYGSARRYLTEQVGLGEPVLEQLRSRLLSCKQSPHSQELHG